MSEKRPHVSVAVIDVVKSWGTASSPEDGCEHLQRGRESLDAAELLVLCQEVAEVSAETLVEVMSLEEGVVDGAVVEFEGIPMLPKQVERVSAWYANQLPIAAALGLTGEVWARLLNGGMATLVGGAASTLSSTLLSEGSLESAQRLLGKSAELFENPPELGTSDKAGLSGILAARSFSGSAKKK